MDTEPAPTLIPLLPQVAGAVGIPVIGAGGFYDGRGLDAGALAIGAAGIAMGTRFLLTSDSPVPDRVKQEYLQSTVTHTVAARLRWMGVPQRMLRTGLAQPRFARGAVAVGRSVRQAIAFEKMSATPWPEIVREGLAMKKTRPGVLGRRCRRPRNTPTTPRASMVDGRIDLGTLASGQVAGVIADLPTCAWLLERHDHRPGRRGAGPPSPPPGTGEGRGQRR